MYKQKLLQYLGCTFLLTLIFACQSAQKEAPPPVIKKAEVVLDTMSEIEENYPEWLNRQERYKAPDNIFPKYKKRNVNYDTLWRKISDGLYWMHLDAPKKCDIGDSKITILQIDPQKYDFKLLCAGAKNEFYKNVEEWSKEENLIAAFNAGMFQRDGKTSSGFLKNYDYINNGTLTSNYKSIFAFNPKTPGIPAARIIDLDCENWDDWKDKYHSYTQGIRMISCDRKNVWSKQKKYWSMVSVATDNIGNVLFCFTRTPYSVHDYNDMLLRMPLDINRMMYLEGGPEASFYFDHLEVEIKQMGSYETGFNENDGNDIFWGLPNVIGILINK